MEINNTTISVFYSSRLFGFAPYTVVRDKFNQIAEIKLSRMMCVYSGILFLVFTLSSNYALMYDINSEHPFRMKTPTSKVVFWLDTNMVVASSFIGMLSGLFGLRNTQQVNRRLQLADKYLILLCKNISINTHYAKQRTMLIVLGVFLYIASMLALDLWGWFRIAARPYGQVLNDVSNIYWFIPFYVMYACFVPLHVKFAQTMYRVCLRYRTLNNALRNSSALAGQTVYFKVDFKNLDDVINQFVDVYKTLGKVMVNVSQEFGPLVITLLVSCLYHFVISAYFVFLEILADKDIYIITLHIFWIIFHGGRLLFIVEPCHLVVMEAEKTMKIVGDLMRTKQNVNALKHFWRQLLADRVYFSACDVCRIDRQLLTSVF